jgi:hypothetical protein
MPLLQSRQVVMTDASAKASAVTNALSPTELMFRILSEVWAEVREAHFLPRGLSAAAVAELLTNANKQLCFKADWIVVILFPEVKMMVDGTGLRGLDFPLSCAETVADLLQQPSTNNQGCMLAEMHHMPALTKREERMSLQAILLQLVPALSAWPLACVLLDSGGPPSAHAVSPSSVVVPLVATTPSEKVGLAIQSAWALLTIARKAGWWV